VAVEVQAALACIALLIRQLPWIAALTAQGYHQVDQRTSRLNLVYLLNKEHGV
jgi:hypothetical protein